MKSEVVSALKAAGLDDKTIAELIEIPKERSRGDYAFPCFVLAKAMKKNPNEIAREIAGKIKSKDFEKVEAVGPYVNFFLDSKKNTSEILDKIAKEKNKYGSQNIGNGKKIIVEMSSPNIAKPFGIGHLRSTIIGNSISRIAEFCGYKTVKINYLGDWGTQFGKMIVGYKRFGKAQELKKDPINYMLNLYIQGNKEEFEQEARDWFKKLEDGNKEATRLWKSFKEISLKNFKEIYKFLGIEFDVISGESLYNKKMQNVFDELMKKNLLVRSEGALIVDLEKEKLGVALIKKTDGATLYATRDLAAAIDRYEKYKFHKMIYEVGQEQKLHFKQFFKILELMGYEWAKDCIHVDHGLYLGQDGKKFATRKGKTVLMEEVLDETVSLAKEEIKKRSSTISLKELDERARKIAISAIFYGDLKNYRSHDIVFDIDRFLSFEGDTGPYLVYSYARANSILNKAKLKAGKLQVMNVNDHEKKLVTELSKFPEVVKNSYEQLAPNLVANYSYQLAQTFNEFYHACLVIGSEEETFRIALVKAFVQVLGNALHLLGIEPLKEM